MTEAMIYISLSGDPDLPGQMYLALLCPGAHIATW